MQTINKKSLEKSLNHHFFIDRDDLQEKDLTALIKNLRNKYLFSFTINLFTMVFIFILKTDKVVYDYILFNILLIASATFFYLSYRGLIFKIKVFFSLPE